MPWRIVWVAPALVSRWRSPVMPSPPSVLVLEVSVAMADGRRYMGTTRDVSAPMAGSRRADCLLATYAGQIKLSASS